MECYSCRSISGEKRISPGPFIHEGKYWLVDHAYPTSLKGWLVIVLKRHAEALHELSLPEFQELAEIQYKLVQLMRLDTTTEKEYMMCFAEGENFHHIHLHVVPKPKDLPSEARGPRIFSLIAVTEAEAVPPHEIIAFCENFKQRYLTVSL